MHLKSVSCLLVVCLLPAVTCVVFSRGRENAYDNQYYEITTSQLQQQCIAIHNRYRAMHGAGPLQYDSQLAAYARQRAIQLAKKDGTNFYHPDNLPYGENLAWNSQEDIDCTLPLKLWYEEWKIYNFQRPNISPRNGHFTQMVWKETTRIGCAQAISQGKKGGTFTVCNYDPPGNYHNEELANVQPASSYDSYSESNSGYNYDYNTNMYTKKTKKYYTIPSQSTTTLTTSSEDYNNKYVSNSGYQNNLNVQFGTNTNYGLDYYPSQVQPKNNYLSQYFTPSVTTASPPSSTFNKWANFRPGHVVYNSLTPSTSSLGKADSYFYGQPARQSNYLSKYYG